MATQRGRDYRNATQWTPHCVAIALLDHTAGRHLLYKKGRS